MAVAETSKQAYDSIKEKLGKNQQIVLGTIAIHEPVSNEKLAYILGWEINRITGRVNELEKAGKIEKSEKYGFSKAGRKVKQWQVKREVKPEYKAVSWLND